MEVRLGMIEVKNNYHNKFKDLRCRNCNKQDETTEPLIECLTPEKDKNKIDNLNQMWSLENCEKLLDVASYSRKIIKNNQFFEYKG